MNDALSRALDRLLAKEYEHGVTNAEQLAKTMVERALAGDAKFRKLVLKYKDSSTNTVARHLRRLLDERDEHGVSVEERITRGQKK